MLDDLYTLFTYLLGWGTVFAYAITAIIGFSCLGKLSPVKGFSNLTLHHGFMDTLRLLSPFHKAELIEDGRGWAMIWFGVAVLSFTSISFSLMHVGYVMSSGVETLGASDSIKWFLTHIFRCIGTSVIIYGAAHGARNHLV